MSDHACEPDARCLDWPLCTIKIHHWPQYVSKLNNRTRITCSCKDHTTMWTTEADARAINAKHVEMQRIQGDG